VSDAIDDDLANRMRATMHLMEQAHDWERIARDESLLEGVREFARQRGEAIREELRP
jgi:hypothetical protein